MGRAALRHRQNRHARCHPDHHEKWDGSGYPYGLKGDDIPLAARLFAVVDVYDALLSDRPYRKAWAEEEVCLYLHSETGRHFDPAAVRSFLAMLEAQTEKPADTFYVFNVMPQPP